VVGAVARRSLRPGGRIIPQRLVTQLAAIEFDSEGWGVWNEDFHGCRLDVVQEFAAPAAQLHFFQRSPVLLSEPVSVTDSWIGRDDAGRLRPSERLRINRPGRLHAIMGYFTTWLTPEVTLSNFPSYPGCNWAVWVWPLRHTTVATNDLLRVALRRPQGVRMAIDWRLDCCITRPGRS
jgi:hypothetical protein